MKNPGLLILCLIFFYSAQCTNSNETCLYITGEPVVDRTHHFPVDTLGTYDSGAKVAGLDIRHIVSRMRYGTTAEEGYITVAEILRAVAWYYRVPTEDVIGGHVKDAAIVAMYLINVHTPRRLKEIAKLFKVKKFAVAQRLNRFKKNQLKQRKYRSAIHLLKKQLQKK